MSILWSMGREKLTIHILNKSISPGPCAYDPKKMVRAHTPSWTMHGTKTRKLQGKSNVPGPGSYELSTKV